MPKLRNGSKGGFEPGFSLLRDRHSIPLSYRAPQSIGLELVEKHLLVRL